jgi:hypothetical protein
MIEHTFKKTLISRSLLPFNYEVSAYINNSVRAYLPVRLVRSLVYVGQGRFNIIVICINCTSVLSDTNDYCIHATFTDFFLASD